MGKNVENFRQSLCDMKEFLSSRKQMKALAEKSNVSLRTVYDTFNASSFEDMKGKQLDVYRMAIQMVTEIKSLPQQADEALN